VAPPRALESGLQWRISGPASELSQLIRGLDGHARGAKNPPENKDLVAEREGFEPPVESPPRRISSAVHSTTLPPLREALAQRARWSERLMAQGVLACNTRDVGISRSGQQHLRGSVGWGAHGRIGALFHQGVGDLASSVLPYRRCRIGAKSEIRISPSLLPGGEVIQKYCLRCANPHARRSSLANIAAAAASAVTSEVSTSRS
jgi:hypothetical protein